MKTRLILIFSILLGYSVANGVASDSLYYRIEMMTPGGTLPFIVEAGYTATSDGFIPFWGVINGSEKIVIDRDLLGEKTYFGSDQDLLAMRSQRVRVTHSIAFDAYDSELQWNGWYGIGLGANNFSGGTEWSHQVFNGRWRKRRGAEYVEIPVLVSSIDPSINDPESRRFEPIPEALLSSNGSRSRFSGHWRVEFESSDEPAIGVFEVDENQLATGTFLTTTGDYRFLEGRVDGPYLRLSTFDGAHAFLFHARMQDDGSIKGDFWSGNWHHETWTAVRDDDAQLPDAFEQTVITDEAALAEAVFRDTDGTPTRVLDALDATKAKARVIEIFGTWCPNCADASRELVSLKEKYGDDLGIVGLAFEVTEGFDRSAQQVQRHHAHIGSDWEVLIAGLSDKDKATKTLGFLDKVRSYPTLVFLDGDNEVQAVYSGFSGPATGDAYAEQRLRFEALIERMIEE